MRFNSFSDAVDKFYSSIEAQKNEQRLANAEREMTKKLENVRRDHDQRLKALDDVQAIQEQRGEYVQCNRDLIEKALLLIRYKKYSFINLSIVVRRNKWGKYVTDRHLLQFTKI